MSPPMPIRAALLALLTLAPPALAAEPLRFQRVVIDGNFPGGYQVEVADVNGDKKPDIVALGGSTLAWYENPTWTKRVISGKAQTPDIISSATADLDGDGKAEIAVAYDFSMNEPKRGKLLLATQGKSADDPWTFTPVADVPSIHRLRWGDLDGDDGLELVVASIFGAKARPPAQVQDPADLTVFLPGDAPKSGRWTSRLIAREPVMHAIEVRAIPGRADRAATIFTADRGGVHRITMLVVKDGLKASDNPIPGAPGPNPGSSEVHLGRLADGRFFLATIDPWHGSEVAVSVAAEPGRVAKFGPRTVIDATLADGHALWVADVDGDGTDEVFAGHRGKDARVSVYKFDGKTWARTVLDPNLTAQDLRGGDIDGDGTPDVVAIGGRSHNVVWFRPVRPK